MKITVLGSGSAFSSPKRFNSCYLIEAASNRFLIDCGSDALRALQKARAKFFSIQKIFITHFHADHCGGLPAVLTAMHVLSRREPMEVFVPSGQLEFVKTWLENVFIYNGRMSFDTALLPIDAGKFNLPGGVKIEFIRTSHLEKYLEYAENSGISARSFSVIVREGKKKFFYSGDISSVNEVAQHIDGSLALIEATHPTLQQIARVSKDGRENVFLTHIPQELEPGGAWRKELREKYGIKKLNAVYDGQVFRI